MAKGIAAFVVVLAAIMSISILSGIGYYDSLNIDYSETGMDDDVAAAADAFANQEASDTSGSPIVEFTTGGANTIQAGWQVLTNTSGVLKLLFGLPDTLANTIETFFRVAFGITFAGFIRGVLIS